MNFTSIEYFLQDRPATNNIIELWIIRLLIGLQYFFKSFAPIIFIFVGSADFILGPTSRNPIGCEVWLFWNRTTNSDCCSIPLPSKPIQGAQMILQYHNVFLNRIEYNCMCEYMNFNCRIHASIWPEYKMFASANRQMSMSEKFGTNMHHTIWLFLECKYNYISMFWLIIDDLNWCNAIANNTNALNWMCPDFLAKT